MSFQGQDNSSGRGSALSRTLQQSLQEVLMDVSFDSSPFTGAPAAAPSFNPLLQQNFNLSAFNITGLGSAGNATNFFPSSSNPSSTPNAFAALGGATSSVSGVGGGASRSASFLAHQPSSTAGAGGGTRFLTHQGSAVGTLSGASGGATRSASYLAHQGSSTAGSTALAALGASAANGGQQMRPSEALGMSTEELLLAASTEKRMIEQRARQQALAEKTLESRRLYNESLLALMKGGNCNVGGNTTGLVAMANPPAANNFFQQGILQQLSKQKNVPKVPSVPPMPNTESKTAIRVLGTSLRKKDSPYLDVSGLRDPDVSDKRTRGGVTEPFPEKLHRMIEEVAAEGKDDIVGFFSHGRAFAVHDPDRFTEEVMPKYFKQSRLSSFQRQLNLYGFTRITSGPDAGGYYHELFLKGRPNLAVSMRRVGLPQGEDRRKMRAKNMRSEPNFYAMGNVKDTIIIPGLQ